MACSALITNDSLATKAFAANDRRSANDNCFAIVISDTPGSGASWFTPGAATPSTLAITGSRVAFEQYGCKVKSSPAPSTYAMSRGWDYAGKWESTPMSFAVTGPHGDVQTWSSWQDWYSTSDADVCGYAQGLRLSTWTFPQGVSVNLVYGSRWDPLGQGSTYGFDLLTEVNNSLGRKIDFSTDSLGRLASFTSTVSGAGQVTLNYQNGITQPLSVTDQMSATTTFASVRLLGSATQRPSGQNFLFQVTTADNPAIPNIQFDYDSEGRVMDVRDAENLQVGDRAPWTFFLADGIRGEHDDPLNEAWNVTYDVYGKPNSYQDENGNVTLASTDGRGRVTQYTYPEGDAEQFLYDDHNNTTQLTKVPKPSSCTPTCPANIVIAATWDQGWNKPLTIEDANLNTTTFTYYASGSGAGELHTATRPAVGGVNPVYTFTYDSAGKLATATDPVTSGTSITTENSYDSSENLLSTQVDPSGLDLETQFAYDSIGNTSSSTDPRGNVTEFFYDLDRRKTETHHHDGGLSALLNAASRTLYDVVGRDYEDDTASCFNGTTCLSGMGITTWTAMKKTTFTATWKPATVTDADNQITQTLYDPADRANTIIDPALREIATVYDPAGNVLQELRAWGSHIWETYATYTYCTAGSTACPNGGDGEKLSVTDAMGSSHITNYAYDGFNRLATATFPDNSTEKLTSYDANGNILQRENRASQFLNYTYDTLNRMATKVIPAYGSTAANTISYSYDLGGRRLGYSDTPGNNIALTNDTAGRLTSVATTINGLSGAKTTTYTLDANGNRTKLLWPDGFYAGYCYDSLNRMTQAQANATDCSTGLLATYQYDTFSRRTNLAYGANASVAYSYTSAGDLISLQQTLLATGNDNTWTLGYAPAHQLASDGPSNTSFKWQAPTGSLTDAYAAVNVLNQYPTVTPNGSSAKTQTWDGNGNLTGDGSSTFSYDPENRLVGAHKSALVIAAYASDPLGRRVEKSGSGIVTTFFLDDGSDEIAEYNGSGALTRRFVPGPAINEPIAMVPASGTTQLFLTDHHGSVVATSDASGNLIEGPFTYDAYGNCFAGSSPCTQSATAEPFKFTGQYFDVEIGCYYGRAREYCADSLHGGRFLQTDPVGYADDLNLYTYVGNDPTDKTDPTGRDETEIDFGYSGIVIDTDKRTQQTWVLLKIGRVGYGISADSDSQVPKGVQTCSSCRTAFTTAWKIDADLSAGPITKPLVSSEGPTEVINQTDYATSIYVLPGTPLDSEISDPFGLKKDIDKKTKTTGHHRSSNNREKGKSPFGNSEYTVSGENMNWIKPDWWKNLHCSAGSNKPECK